MQQLYHLIQVGVIWFIRWIVYGEQEDLSTDFSDWTMIEDVVCCVFRIRFLLIFDKFLIYFAFFDVLCFHTFFTIGLFEWFHCFIDDKRGESSITFLYYYLLELTGWMLWTIWFSKLFFSNCTFSIPGILNGEWYKNIDIVYDYEKREQNSIKKAEFYYNFNQWLIMIRLYIVMLFKAWFMFQEALSYDIILPIIYEKKFWNSE